MDKTLLKNPKSDKIWGFYGQKDYLNTVLQRHWILVFFLSNMCILIQFLKAIGWWTHQTLCLFQPCEYLVIKKLNFRVIEYDLKNLWLNTVVTRTKRHGVTWKTTNFQHPILWIFQKPEEKKICLMYLLYQSHLRLMSKEFFSMNKYSKRQKKQNGQPIMSHRDARCFSNILFWKKNLTVLKILL